MSDTTNIMIMPPEARATNWREAFLKREMFMTAETLSTGITMIYNVETETFDECMVVDDYKETAEGLYLPKGEIFDLMDPVPAQKGITRELNYLTTGCANKRHHRWGVESFNISNQLLYEMETEEGKSEVCNIVRDEIYARSDDVITNHRRFRQEAILQAQCRGQRLPSWLQ